MDREHTKVDEVACCWSNEHDLAAELGSHYEQFRALLVSLI